MVVSTCGHGDISRHGRFVSTTLLVGVFPCCGRADDVADEGWMRDARCEIRVFRWQKLRGRDKMKPLGYLGLFIDDDRRIRAGRYGTRPVPFAFISWRRLKTCQKRFFHGWLCRHWQ